MIYDLSTNIEHHHQDTRHSVGPLVNRSTKHHHKWYKWIQEPMAMSF